jgi:hypothetical protein
MQINHYEVLSIGLSLAAILCSVSDYVSGRRKMVHLTPEQIYQAHRTGTAPPLTPLAVALRRAAAAIALASIAYQCWIVLYSE